MKNIKTQLSYNESLGRISVLQDVENIVAVDCVWEDADFADNWFPMTPKLADRIAIVNDYKNIP